MEKEDIPKYNRNKEEEQLSKQLREYLKNEELPRIVGEIIAKLDDKLFDVIHDRILVHLCDDCIKEICRIQEQTKEKIIFY
ncbi:hypothetical protein LCGC14_1797160 [marine sediment metagenome]|uniref:Uncharacterized protein n=1 Tax=marine sediment metagenome TaxID=412755 RepID=A0A0F9HDE3_9ZZZZ